MSRNERSTCKELIEPALARAGWTWDEQLHIGPGRVNLTGESMYDDSQAIIADYLLRYTGIPLAIMETKAEGEPASDGIQQGSRYAQRLSLRFSIATNGSEWILTDNETGTFECFSAPPTPEDIVRHHGVTIDWDRWSGAFTAAYHIDQVNRKRVRPYQDVAIFRTLWTFARGIDRALLLKATGTGKTFTVFQLVWKLMNGGALPRQHVLFLTDRNSLKDQAFRSFSAFPATERVVIDRETVAKGQHLVGKVFFASPTVKTSAASSSGEFPKSPASTTVFPTRLKGASKRSRCARATASTICPISKTSRSTSSGCGNWGRPANSAGKWSATGRRSV